MRAIIAAALFLTIGTPGGAQHQVGPAIQSESDRELIAILLRTTLIAVHQANFTGNYTLLRDLAAPGFQERNTAADLALIFAPIRRQYVDLSPAVLLEAQFTRPPVIDQQNILRMTGTLPTKPVPVAFDLAYQAVKGSWRLHGIAIAPANARTNQ